MPETTASAGQSSLLATFTVRGLLCALDATTIQEVIRLGPLTPVRHAAEMIAGILNLRGKIVTILDLGLLLGFAPAVPGADGRIIIMEDRGEFLGLLADSVADVVEVDPSEWEPPPANVAAAQRRFLHSVCRVDGRVITLLDPAEILAEA